MLSTYKAFVNNEWIYGEIKTDVKNNNITYYIVDKNGISTKVNKDNICKITKLIDKLGANVYDNDIIAIDTEEGVHTFIVKYYDGSVKIDNIELYIDGLVLLDFNFTPYLISTTLLNNNTCIEIIGNSIENNIKNFNIKDGDK